MIWDLKINKAKIGPPQDQGEIILQDRAGEAEYFCFLYYFFFHPNSLLLSHKYHIENFGLGVKKT